MLRDFSKAGLDPISARSTARHGIAPPRSRRRGRQTAGCVEAFDDTSLDNNCYLWAATAGCLGAIATTVLSWIAWRYPRQPISHNEPDLNGRRKRRTRFCA